MRTRANDIFWGVVWIAVGTILLLDNLEIVYFDFSIAKYWPIILILLGISSLLKVASKKA